MGQHEPVVQPRAPADQLALDRVFPEPGDQRADQQLLGKAHLGVWRHFEAAEFHEPQPAGRAVGGIELVDADFRAVRVAGHIDQQIAEQAVDQPGPGRVALAGRGHLRHGDFKLVEAVVPRLVKARGLRSRTDEQAGKQIGQRRVALPVQDQRFEQVGAAQERAVIGRRAANNDVVTAAGARVLAVDHEFIGAQSRQPRLFIDRLGDRDALVPICRRVDIDLDDAGVGRHPDHIEARVRWRGIAFDVDRQAQLFGRCFGGSDQFEIVLEFFGGRHEHGQSPIARFDRKRGAHLALDIGDFLFDLRLGDGLVCDAAGHRQFVARRQGCARDGGVLGHDMGIIAFGDMGQGAQRQAIAHGRIPGHQKQLAAPCLPDFCQPARGLRGGVPFLDRQHIAGRIGQPTFEDPRHAQPFLWVLEFGIGRVDVFGKIAFLEDPVGGVFKGRLDGRAIQPQRGGKFGEIGFGLIGARGLVRRLVGDQIGIFPHRLAVLAPVEREGPARQGFARIPLSLPVMKEPAGRETLLETADQDVGFFALGGPDRIGIPLAGFEVVDGNEGRLAPHRQPNVIVGQIFVNLAAPRAQVHPRIVRKWLGDARMFGHAGDLHVEIELDIGKARHPRNRGGIGKMRGRRERDMAFPGQQSRGRIEPHPAAPRQVHLAPGMEVSEVAFGARWTIEGLEIRL